MLAELLLLAAAGAPGGLVLALAFVRRHRERRACRPQALVQRRPAEAFAEERRRWAAHREIEAVCSAYVSERRQMREAA